MMEYLERIISTALAEDIGAGDITSALTIPPEAKAEMKLLARQEMVACGVDVPELVFNHLSSPPTSGDPGTYGTALLDSRFRGNDNITIETHVADGDMVQAGTVLVSLKGNARMLLTGERTALNIMQRMSGVATLTRQYVEAVAGTKAIILDTRKTMPGLRMLDKYATRCGGAENHRMRLDDMVLIKDNHLVLGTRYSVLSIQEIIEKVKLELSSRIPNPESPIPIVVECDTLEQVAEAIAAKPDRILLDNMNNDMLRAVVAMSAGSIPLEASGNVSLETVRGISETGVDYISVGKITHSAPAVDIGADIHIQN